MAGFITDPVRRADALVAVARGLAEAGQVDRAESVARSITDQDRWADALVAVAEAVPRGSDAQRAQRLLAAACTCGSWTRVLGSILSLDEKATSAIADLCPGIATSVEASTCPTPRPQRLLVRWRALMLTK